VEGELISHQRPAEDWSHAMPLDHHVVNRYDLPATDYLTHQPFENFFSGLGDQTQALLACSEMERTYAKMQIICSRRSR
jgi:hypothetical protein